MKKALGLLAAVALSFAGANSLDQIKSANTLKIGVADHSAPFSKLNRDGEFEGFEVDLGKEIAKAILGEGGRVEFVAVKASERAKAVTENRVDLLIDNFARTPARAKDMDFSIPYLSVTLGAVSPKSAGIQKVGDLNGKKLLIIPDTNSDVWAKKNPNLGQIVYCHSNRECMDALLEGQADAYMHNIVNIATIPLLHDDYEIGIQRIGQVLFDCVATQKGNHDLLHVVDEKILELADKGFFHNEYQKTFEPFYKGTVDEKLFILEDIYEAFQ